MSFIVIILVALFLYFLTHARACFCLCSCPRLLALSSSLYNFILTGPCISYLRPCLVIYGFFLFLLLSTPFSQIWSLALSYIANDIIFIWLCMCHRLYTYFGHLLCISGVSELEITNEDINFNAFWATGAFKLAGKRLADWELFFPAVTYKAPTGSL